MDAAAATGLSSTNVLASFATARMINTTNLIQPTCSSARLEVLALHPACRSICRRVSSGHGGPFPSIRSTVFVTRCSTKPGIDSNSAINKNTSIEVDSNSTARHLASSSGNQELLSTCSRGLVFDLGPKESWDGMEIGSPVVKRYIGDNEERWYMWYHGRRNGKESDSIGLAASSNGIHWIRGGENVRSCGDIGMVMTCSPNWWGFDTLSVRPSEMVIMSSPMYSSVYWLYYTGFTSEEVEISELPKFSLENPERFCSEDRKDGNYVKGKIFKSLPGLACSQDGRHWARIEGDHHSGAILDVGTGKEWDSSFIAAPHVVVHDSDDLRMYYHSFDVKKGHFAVGMARSRDGIRWVKLGRIMGGGSIGSFDECGVKHACVIRNRKEGNYLMAYEGVSADGKRSIGLAESPDGLKNWKKLQEEPVLKPSEDDGWDNQAVASPCLVPMEGNINEWTLYYVGFNQEERTGIGMAVSEGSNVRSFRRWENSLVR
ncbi:hypothetical protein SLA2020_027960 [Shorea laevis]